MDSDKTIICKDCGEEFIFTFGEQEFYREHGFDKPPVRCKNCRNLRKQSSGGYQRPKRVLYEIVCSRCGKVESIPFEPKHDRPVFCNDCYRRINEK